MPISEAQMRAVAKYNSNNYDQIQVRVPKGWKEKIIECCNIKEETLNGFMKRIIKNELSINGIDIDSSMNDK